jgi:predicted dehydrogenase
VKIQRRAFLQTSMAALAVAAPRSKGKYRVGIIGHMGRYGHSWDTAWKGIPNVEVVGIADRDDKGRKAGMERSGAKNAYRDYREMIASEKPDLVAICPGLEADRLSMITAAAEGGAHILLEKPFAQTLQEADAIVAITEKHGVKVQVGHTARVMPVTVAVKKLLEEGKLGVLFEMRGRGKEDGRAGGIDLMILGTHVLDLMRYYAGDPSWVFAHVTEQGGELRPAMMRESESAGRVGGDRVEAVFAFPNGVHGHFGSKPNDRRSWGVRFGLTLCGSDGFAAVPLKDVPSKEPHLLRSPSWTPDRGEQWERVNYPPGQRFSTREDANRAMVLDLLEAIEQDRPPACCARDGRWTIEMVSSVYQSQWSGGRVAFPLSRRSI